VSTRMESMGEGEEFELQLLYGEITKGRGAVGAIIRF
jgi:hypothetical protein